MDRIPTSPVSCQPVVEKLLPANSVHLLAGAPGAGKTALSAWLLRQVQDSRAVFGYHSHAPAAMGVIVADRGWVSHAQWFDAVGLGQIPHYSFHDDRAFRWDSLKHPDGWMFVLINAIHKLKLPPHSLVLVDPLTSFLGGGDLLNYGRVFSSLGELGQFCVASELTILGTAHAGKQRGGRQFQYARPQDRILGSTALVGCADTVMYLATPTETRGRYWELHWAPHHAPAASCLLLRNDQGLFEMVPPLAQVPSLTAVLEMVPDIETPLQALVDDARGRGLSRSTLFRRLRELRARGLVANSRAGHWYRTYEKKPH